MRELSRTYPNAYDAELPSLQKCLIVLGASEKDVYYVRRPYPIKLGGGSNRSIYELGEEVLLNWVKELHHMGVKRYQHDETAIKCLNIARQRAEHLIEYYFNGGKKP